MAFWTDKVPVAAGIGQLPGWLGAEELWLTGIQGLQETAQTKLTVKQSGQNVDGGLQTTEVWKYHQETTL